MRVLLCVLFVCISALWVVTAADEAAREEILRQGVDPDKVNAAVKKGVEYLKSQQGADGSWKGQRLSSQYPEGVSALCGYALVKAGEPVNSECITKLLHYLRNQPFRTVYSVSTLIMFLSALATPPPVKKEAEELVKNPGKKMRTSVFEPHEKRMRKQMKKLPGWVKDLLKKAVQWLISKQSNNIWRYPGPQPGGRGGIGPNEDASNTQYAMLALHCAMQVGISVPKSVFMKVIPWFLQNQDKDGPEVKGFRVPAADLPIYKLKKLEKQILDSMKKRWEARVDAWKKAKKEGKTPPKLTNPRTEVIEIDDPYKKFGAEPGKMKARGWCYVNRAANGIVGNDPRIGQMRTDWTKTTGSMTTSGVISLIIAKSQVERQLNKSTLQMVNQSIRDGFGWLLKNWTVSSNPNHPCWHLYYLYGIERCAILGLVDKIGKHNWYKEGAEYLMGAQQADGSWQGESESPSWARGELGVGPVENTCFALLFLLRATVPIIKPPTQIFTGEGLGISKQPPEK